MPQGWTASLISFFTYWNSENWVLILPILQMSYQYLTGSTIDYVEGLEGAMFVVNNPNATSNCGCGSSLSI